MSGVAKLTYELISQNMYCHNALRRKLTVSKFPYQFEGTLAMKLTCGESVFHCIKL